MKQDPYIRIENEEEASRAAGVIVWMFVAVPLSCIIMTVIARYVTGYSLVEMFVMLFK
jgi:hypothetical protein